MSDFSIKTKWVHFIGIGGVAMAPLAREMSLHGYEVSGSDKDIYEPIKSFLVKTKISVYKGFSYNNLIKGTTLPELVICGSGISLKNREYLFAKKQGLQIRHYPQVLQEEIICKNSIVVAGTYAKSTIIAMLVSIFKLADIDISYMFGALPSAANKSFKSIKFKDVGTKYSIVEGDEYIASRWDKKSKFFYYNPKYLILTAAQWDHTDIFSSEEDYVDNFRKLVSSMPYDGFIFANGDDKNVKKLITASGVKNFNFFYFDELTEWGEENKIATSAIGDYNYKNALVAGYFASLIEIPMDVIRKALLDFRGLKRRLEIRYSFSDSTPKLVIIDDFASSPAKVKGSISTIKKQFPDHKLNIIFEPNTGSRTKLSLKNYTDAFRDADFVLLPKFTELIKSDNYTVDEKVLGNFLQNNKINVEVFERNNDLFDKIKGTIKSSDNTPQIIAFMSSQGMEELILESINLAEL